jgi:hypothetical protein
MKHMLHPIKPLPVGYASLSFLQLKSGKEGG